MSGLMLPLPAAALLLVAGLGVRHGLDPDHVAAVDGLTFSALRHSQRQAVWTGPFFALGHGLVMTATMILAVLLGGALTVVKPVETAIEWLPVLLLAVMGAVNLRALLSQGPYCPGGLKSRLLPGLTCGHSLPLVALLTGMAFAFDGVPQGFVLGGIVAPGGAAGALLAGALLTAFMAAIAAFDSRTLVKLGAGGGDRLALYRRISGWAVVVLAFLMAGYETTALLWPRLALGDGTCLAIGAFLVISIWAIRAFGVSAHAAWSNLRVRSTRGLPAARIAAANSFKTAFLRTRESSSSRREETSPCIAIS